MTGTVFTKVDFQLNALVEKIELGDIGLPDIQRPFVWEAAKVRDLFDSMYSGYPVGHLLFWESGAEPGARQIGTREKQVAPKLLIVDGQQRLTSLYAVMKQRPVLGQDYAEKRIQIAFRPRDAVFAVADAAVRKDPAFLQDIGEIWSRNAFQVITAFLARLREAGALEEDDERRIPEALGKLESLRTYPFTALVLGAAVDETDVAEVFVRINSKGKTLNQADFILTLMSVYWDEGRAQLEAWSRDARTPGDAAANSYLKPDPDHLLRVAIALGFRRGRLADVYQVLRGRDRTTGQVSAELRQQQLGRLASAQARVLDKEVWKEFLQCLLRAGHRSSATISSNLALLYTYALYLIGKHDYKVPPKQLREVIARWFFMSSLTGRYSFSPESRIASDLGALPSGDDPESFVRRLDETIAQQLTNDYWEITLPSELATSASRSPSLFGYLAALSILDAPVLFSKMRCTELLDPTFSGTRIKVERHHLFPRKYLEDLGIVELKQVNQIANLALLEWHDNLSISAADPAVYWPAYLEAMRNPPAGVSKLTEAEIEAMIHLHSLPENWPAMPYDEFLVERRRRMARVMRQAFERLVRGEQEEREPTWPPSPAAIEHLLHEGETSHVELKASLRADTLGRGVPPKVLEKVAARTVAGFLNAQGGMLIIGANDDGVPLGLDADVETHGREKEFHVRAGNTTRILDVEEAASYIGQHWKGRE